VGLGGYDPLQDVSFLEREIVYWMKEIIKKGWESIARRCELEGKKVDKMLAERLTGLGVSEDHIHSALRSCGLSTDKPSQWSDDELLSLSEHIRKISKPMLIAYNKIDIAPDALVEKAEEIQKNGYVLVKTSAESELALTHAEKNGFLEYTPGNNDFSVVKSEELSEKQLHALEYIRSHVLQKYGSTGIQQCIEEAVRMLDLLVVYPVEDDTHLTDKEGRVLPDAYFMPRGCTAKDLAYKVHTDLGDHFIRAIDARTHRVIGADHELKDGDVIRIVANV
jgi:ribosome-binding ATPase YchF (GTP1/OBG family)